MKVKFYTKFFIAMGLFMFQAMILLSQTTPPDISVGTASLSGGTYSVPIVISDYTNVGNISLKLLYDPSKVEYTGTSLNTGLSLSNAVLTPVSDQSGVIGFSFTSATAIVLQTPVTTLLTFDFIAKPGVQATPVALTWSTAQGANDITPPSPDVFVPEISASNFISGTLNLAPIPVITGPNNLCVGSTGNIYSTAAGMSNYVWTVSSGGTITSGDGTNSISVDWSASGPQQVAVTYDDPVTGPAETPTVYAVTVNDFPVPTITGPLDGSGMPATLSGGSTLGQVYTTESGMTDYLWTVSTEGTIISGQGTESITVDWVNPTGQQTVTVSYTGNGGCAAVDPTILIINYYPFAPPIDPGTIPQFVDPMPHFAAGLRINARAGGSLIVKAQLAQQVALSTGTVLTTGTVGDSPTIGLGNYEGYAISTDGGSNFTAPMWPARTIEAQQGNQLTVEYRNELTGLTYSDFNILADQTLMMNGYPQNGNILTDPYTGPIPMVVHLHGGEMPSNSDGGPTAWFMPNYSLMGPGFLHNASAVSTYPNQQEETTLWYHPHDQGLTRINVYTGLAGFYFLRGDAEEAAHLPGWSGDDLVQETTPAGKSPTFNGTTPYLPEIELAVQDRMFNDKGELYWPVAPTNPDLHPFWTPEFFGDVMTVNGKSWPYLSVAPRKYRFRMLNGCNARFLNIWLQDLATSVTPPVIYLIGTDGGLLDTPVPLTGSGNTALWAPAERFDVIIDFSGIPDGTTFTLMNNANAPYPDGDPVIDGLTDRIMQFVVNGQMVASAGGTGADLSVLPGNVRPSNPMVKLTDFAGGLSAGVTPDLKRQIILNEVSGAGGPVQVLFNNSLFDESDVIAGAPLKFGGPTETPVEGTTELIQIVNTTVDAHPIHIHLTQWQLVSRQAFDANAYMTAYQAAWATRGVPEWPFGLGYPGGGGPPNDYNILNSDGAVGGNPSVSSFLIGSPVAALPEENGWKDDVKVFPGEVATFVVRYAPTDRPINATPEQLLYPFDPSLGPGYVWHCHIIDHEDMDMMRPLLIQPSPLRLPQITSQPASLVACAGYPATFSVTISNTADVTYDWQISTDNGTSWTSLTNGAPYSGVNTSTLTIDPATADLSSNLYKCVMTNLDGTTESDAALLTVNQCNISGTVMYNNPALDPLEGFTVSAGGKSADTGADGSFTIVGVNSGNYLVTVDPKGRLTGGINSTDAGLINYWFANTSSIPAVKFLAGDVDNSSEINAIDAQKVQRYFVLYEPFAKPAWVFGDAMVSGITNPPALTVDVNGTSVSNFNIRAQATGDFNESFLANAPAKGTSQAIQLVVDKSVNVTAAQEFELPLRPISKMQAGAVSLILNIPSDLVEVKSVSVKGSTTPITWDVKGNTLRIGWNSMTPVTVQADEDLVVLKLKATPSFVEGMSCELILESNPLNEIANGNFETIPDVVLKADAIVAVSSKGETLATNLLLNCYPNPVSGTTTVYYTLPEDGFVTMAIYNSIGVAVNTIVKENRSAGNYSTNVDVSSLPHGIYMVNLKLTSNNVNLNKTIKLIIK